MKDDKKKVLILGVLAVVIVGVGAFQFLGGSAPAPSPEVATKDENKEKAKATEAGVEETETPKNPLYAADLPQRDPFQERSLPGQPPKVSEVTQPAPQNLPAPRSGGRRSGGTRSSGDFSVPPVTIGGSLPSGPLPGAGGPLTLTPSGPDPNEFTYHVSGVIVGQRPAAVFSDSQGNQRLVPVGGSLDGDSKVVSIDKGQVTVEHRGKKLRLPLGGNPK